MTLEGHLVSVVIPTFNRPDLLAAALDSVARQRIASKVEVIVINDGGPSVTHAVRPQQMMGLSIRLLELDAQRGPASARNAAVEHASGRYIAFLDDDDLFGPEHLAVGCEVLERDEADFVYLGALVAEQRLHRLPEQRTGFPHKAYAYDNRVLHVVNYLHTGSVIVRNFRSTNVRFDEKLDVCEDWDLWLALTTVAGYRVRFINRITSIYHQIPNLAGLVADAQQVSPSAFAVARSYLHAKWPSDDPLVTEYRDWIVAFEQHRSELIAQRQRMPNLLFDSVLTYVHDRMSRGESAERIAIPQFFTHGGRQ